MNDPTRSGAWHWRWAQVGLLLVVCVQGSALVAVLAPQSTLDAVAVRLGLEPLGNSPLPIYLARQCSALYVLHAGTLLAIAWRLPQSLPVVPLVGGVTIFFGILMLGIGWSSHMPWWWQAIEGPSIIVGGSLLVLLHRMVAGSSQAD
jgi:hypothetical protein